MTTRYQLLTKYRVCQARLYIYKTDKQTSFAVTIVKQFCVTDRGVTKYESVKSDTMYHVSATCPLSVHILYEIRNFIQNFKFQKSTSDPTQGEGGTQLNQTHGYSTCSYSLPVSTPLGLLGKGNRPMVLARCGIVGVTLPNVVWGGNLWCTSGTGTDKLHRLQVRVGYLKWLGKTTESDRHPNPNPSPFCMEWKQISVLFAAVR